MASGGGMVGGDMSRGMAYGGITTSGGDMERTGSECGDQVGCMGSACAGPAAMCVQPEGHKTQVSWKFVGHGRGGYEQMPAYSFVGENCGSFEAEQVIVPYGWKARPTCCGGLSLLALIALCGCAAYMVSTRTDATTTIVKLAMGEDCDEGVAMTDARQALCCRMKGLLCTAGSEEPLPLAAAAPFAAAFVASAATPAPSTAAPVLAPEPRAEPPPPVPSLRPAAVAATQCPPEIEATGCDSSCLYSFGVQGPRTCRERVEWKKDAHGQTGARTWANAIDLVNTECLCQCSCTPEDFAQVGECLMWGDPHIITFDGSQSSFYGEGEVWIVRSETVLAQVRYMATPYTNSLAATHDIAITGPFLDNHVLKVGPMNGGHIRWDTDVILSEFGDFNMRGLGHMHDNFMQNREERLSSWPFSSLSPPTLPPLKYRGTDSELRPPRHDHLHQQGGGGGQSHGVVRPEHCAREHWAHLLPDFPIREPPQCPHQNAPSAQPGRTLRQLQRRRQRRHARLDRRPHRRLRGEAGLDLQLLHATAAGPEAHLGRLPGGRAGAGEGRLPDDPRQGRSVGREWPLQGMRFRRLLRRGALLHRGHELVSWDLCTE